MGTLLDTHCLLVDFNRCYIFATELAQIDLLNFRTVSEQD